MSPLSNYQSDIENLPVVMVTDDLPVPVFVTDEGMNSDSGPIPAMPELIPMTVGEAARGMPDPVCQPQPTPGPPMPPQGVKRGPGRPRKVRPNGEIPKPTGATRGRKPGQSTKGNHLWEFVRDLLKDTKFNPKVIKWEDEEDRVFRIVQSEQVAKMWGNKKNNPNMTYEKLSRALRYVKNHI